MTDRQSVTDSQSATRNGSSSLAAGVPMNARAQELETAREEQILASARKLFAEKGYDRTTV